MALEQAYTPQLPISQGVPPQSSDAERSVLGAVLQDHRSVSLAVENLRPEDFYSPAHREIFSAILTLNTQGTAIDLVTVDTELTRRGTLGGIGGSGYLVDMMTFVPTTVNTQYYIAIVLQKATLRKLIDAATAISRNCYEQHMDMQDILSHAEKSIFDIVMRRTGGDTLLHIYSVLKTAYAQMEELARLKGAISGVPTGFFELDSTLTGLHGGELILVGARPSMGKTAFAINIAAYAARKGKTVAFFSLEMPREQIAIRILCSDARVNMQHVRSGTMNHDEWGKLVRSLGLFVNAPIYMDDSGGLTPTQIRSRCRRLMMEKGLDLVVIDYLQLMSADGRIENRQQEVSDISRRLKAIALELKVPVMACAQLSRATVATKESKPMLSHLRESGSMEQDADVVMFLHRENYYDPSKDPNLAEVIIAKQRNGPLANIQLGWLNEYTLFTNPYQDKKE